MNEHDTLQRFIFEHAAIRGEIVHLTHSYQEILAQHCYPPKIQQYLGETLAAAVLLTATIKFEGDLTIQFHGVGPIKLLVAKCDHNFHLRGLAQFDETVTSHDFETAFNQGRLVITLSNATSVTPYQSIVPINGLSISECLENYFAQSEQLATKIFLAVNDTHAAGMLLQLMPATNSHEREDFWSYAVKIGETLTAKELFHLDNEVILHRLYHQEDLRLFDRELVIFKCSCNIEKMKNAIAICGEQEADELLKLYHKIEVCCEFCNQKYCFDAVDVASIFHSIKH